MSQFERQREDVLVLSKCQHIKWILVKEVGNRTGTIKTYKCRDCGLTREED